MTSVVVDDLDVVCVAIAPTKADAPLIVDTDAVLAGTVALELLQAVTRRHSQVFDRLSRVDRDELSEHHATQIGGESADGVACEQALSVPVGKALDHDER